MAEISYLDFDLLIERLGENTYRARVLSSPAGQAVTEVTLPFSDLELENFLLKIGRTRRGVRRLESPEMEAAKVFGGKLFKSIFDGELMSCFRISLDEANKQQQGLRIRLRLNDAPELVNLPWEYLYNPSLNRFLSLSVDTPLVRYLELPERISPLTITPPMRVLAVISSPSDYPKLDVEREWNNLNSALEDLEQSGLLVLDRLETASPVELQYSLRRNEYHVIHFIGHGGFNEQAQDGILMFEDENQRGRPLSGQYLGTLLHDEKTLRLAVLNACEGARSGSTDPFAGVAQSLVQQGLPAVIAMQFEVTDEAAITFAREFYTAVAEGYPVDAALAEARKAIFSRGNDIEWGTPVLYMRAPDGQVFDVSKAAPPESRMPAARVAPPTTVPPESRMPEGVRGGVLSTETARQLEQLYTDGLSAYWLKDWGKAWECFRQVVEIDPDYEDAAHRLESVKRQLTLATLSGDADRSINEGNWLDAKDALQRLVAQEPTYRDATARLEQVNKNLQLADLYDQARQLHQSHHWQAVLNVFEQIHALQPDYPDPDGLLESARRESATNVQARAREMLEPVAVPGAQPDAKPLPRRWVWIAAGGLLLVAVITGVLLLGGGPEPEIVVKTVPAAVVTGAPTQVPEEPTTVVTEAPAVVVTEAPAIVVTEAPAVVVTEAPTIVVTEAPAVVVTEAPASIADAGLIAFNSDRSGNNDIYVMYADGSAVTQLTSGASDDRVPSWSPDGSRIAYQSNQGGDYEITIYDLRDGQVHQVTDNDCHEYNPVWSPDGEWFAYYSTCQYDENPDGNREIFKIRVDGSERRQLTHTEGVYNWFPNWSRDGKQITFSSRRSGKYEVFIMDADGSGVRPLAPGCISAFSPDGGQLVFAQYCLDIGEIYLIDSDGSNLQTLIGGENNANPSWTPDGKWILFQSGAPKNEKIWMIRPDGTDLRQLTFGEWRDSGPVWQPVPGIVPGNMGK